MNESNQSERLQCTKSIDSRAQVIRMRSSVLPRLETCGHTDVQVYPLTCCRFEEFFVVGC